jgi:hypothetical protein
MVSPRLNYHLISLTFTAIISSPSLKRRAVSPDGSDSENIDPKAFDLKRKRASLDNDVSFSKPAPYSLTPSAQGPRVLPATPRLDTVARSTTPVSAPAAAGRSPTRKRQSLQPRRRFLPPSLGTKSPSLSIAAALNGTLAHKKTRKARTIEESKPKSWFFDVFEEPEQVQHDRMNDWTMSQSATNLLDISDDEVKAERAHNDRGKENVDPNAIPMPVTRSMAAAKAASEDLKKDLMLDDRIPLGDLNPAQYYPEGLDATSVVLVHDDVPEETTVKCEPTPVKSTFTFEAEQALPTEVEEVDVRAVLEAAAPKWDAIAVPSASPDPNEIPRLQPGEDLDIWESESAKDENEKLQNGESGFALQEL